jgi:hypothetical protein
MWPASRGVFGSLLKCLIRGVEGGDYVIPIRKIRVEM